MVSTSKMDNNRLRSRLKLGLLALVFVAPVAASYFTFYVIKPSGPDSTTNHGHLVEPARPLFTYPKANNHAKGDASPSPKSFLAAADLRNADGAPVTLALFRSRWTLLYIARTRCADVCRKRLYDTRQVRTATGRHRDRVNRILLLIDPADVSALTPFLSRAHPDLKLVVGHLPAATGLVRFFSPSMDEGTGAVTDSGRVYLIDPLGNWFMYYLPGEPAKGILEDLHKVMRASSIG